MAEPTSAEKRLLRLVDDANLKTSLRQIRDASEAIWSPDGPRMIRGYTGHGIPHSERVANWAVQLLEANTGAELTTEEAYLLLAGIYLHDIGMQCDVVHHPEVKARAEQLGAVFEIDFTPGTPSTYSPSQQQALRANHHYLAAAWIECARKSNTDWALVRAAKSIPPTRVRDVMDVCRLHSKLPIGECPKAFQIGGTGRKRLVAALLRFADELDVDAQRVSIDTLQAYRLPPASAAYWWVHALTTVSFPERHLVMLTVCMHPEDFANLASPVREGFIAHFERKNRGVLTVLAGGGVPIQISGDSDVVPLAYADRLPEAIVGALLAMVGPQDRDRLHQLPADLPDFTGRAAETELLVKLLRGGHRGAAISGLAGAGGLGKTALAVHVMHAASGWYPDAQIVVDLKGTLDRVLAPADAMKQVIHAFRPQVQLPTDEAMIAGWYQAILAERQVLLLLDNAKDAAHVQPLLPPPPCAVLVTSRRRLRLPDLEEVELGPLPACDSILLLSKMLGEQEVPAEHVSAVVKLCDHVPLALRVAGNVLGAHSSASVAESITRLERARASAFGGPEHAVAAVLRWSASVLALDCPVLASRWQMLSVFAGPFELGAAAAVWDTSREETQQCLDDLVRRGLATRDTKLREYRLHALTRQAARQVITHARTFPGKQPEAQRLRDASSRYAWHYLLAGSTAEDMFHQGGEQMIGALVLFDQALPHLMNAWEHLGGSEDEAGLSWVAMFPAAMPRLLCLRLHPLLLIEIVQAARGAAIAIGDRKTEGRLLGALGVACALLGRLTEATRHYERAIELARETGDRANEGIHLGNLGNAYMSMGEADKSVPYFEEALRMVRGAGDRRTEGGLLCNLGAVYNALGKHQMALRCHNQAHVIAHEVGDRQLEGATLGNLGLAQARLGDYREAAKLHQSALTISQELGDRLGEGSDLGNLASAYEALGNFQQARRCLVRAVAVLEAINSPQAEKAREHLARLG